MKFFSRLIKAANTYIGRCSWTDLALVKFCLCSMGVMIGLALPAAKKKPAFFAAAAVFTATYIPLMAKFLPVLTDAMKEKEEKAEETV